MDNRRRLTNDRERAVRRNRAGEDVTTIAASLGRSRQWVYKWCTRATEGGVTWAAERSRQPHGHSGALPADVVAAVRLIRLELYNAGLFCGAQNIRWRLEELAVTPLPSVRTINRIVACEGLTYRRTGRYVPKGKVYPALPAERAN
jgi:putative transposase